MKSGIIVKEFDMPFNAVCHAITQNIKSAGFLLLHQINTQDIVSKHGIAIRPLKQFLFFHPTYIDQIIKQDPLAINEIPVKVVVYDQGDGPCEFSKSGSYPEGVRGRSKDGRGTLIKIIGCFGPLRYGMFLFPAPVTGPPIAALRQ